MHVNDIANCMNTGPAIMIAGDINLFFNSDSYSKLYEKMNEQLQTVYFWLPANKLALNTKKSKYITLKPHNSYPP